MARKSAKSKTLSPQQKSWETRRRMAAEAEAAKAKRKQARAAKGDAKAA